MPDDLDRLLRQTRHVPDDDFEARLSARLTARLDDVRPSLNGHSDHRLRHLTIPDPEEDIMRPVAIRSAVVLAVAALGVIVGVLLVLLPVLNDAAPATDPTIEATADESPGDDAVGNPDPDITDAQSATAEPTRRPLFGGSGRDAALTPITAATVGQLHGPRPIPLDPMDQWVYSLAFHPSNDYIAVGSLVAFMVEPRTGEHTPALNGFGTQYDTMRITPDGRYLILGSSRGGGQIVEIEDHDRIFYWPPVSLTGVFVVRLNAAGDRMLSVHRDIESFGEEVDDSVPRNGLMLWDISGIDLTIIGEGEDRHIAAPPQELGAIPRSLSITPLASGDLSRDGSLAASGDDLGVITLYSTPNLDPVWTIEAHDSAVTELAFSPDASRLASGTEGGDVVIWDVASGEALFTTAGHEMAVTGLAFTPDGSVLISAGFDGVLHLWDAATGAELRSFELPQTQFSVAKILALAIDPAGTRIAISVSDSTVQLLAVDD